MDSDIFGPEDATEQCRAGGGGEAPVIDYCRVDPANSRYGCQQDAARTKNAMAMLDGRLQVVDVLKRLGQDEAVEMVRRNCICRLQVSHDRRLRVGRINVQHLRPLHVAPVVVCIVSILYFQNVSSDLLSM